MKTRSFFSMLLSSAVLLTAFTACQSSSANEGNEAAPDGVQAAALDYWRLVGNAGERDIVVHLMREAPMAADSSVRYAGVIYEEGVEDPMPLFGSVDAAGRIRLTETLSPTGQEFGRFVGTWHDDGLLEGSWSDSGGQRLREFNLRPEYPAGSVMFDVYYRVDSLLLKSDSPESPQARISMTWLHPSDSTDSRTRSFLEKEIRKGVLGDSLAGVYNSMAEGFTAIRDQFFQQYRDESAGVDPNDTLYLQTLNYDRTDAVKVYYNNDNLLTLGFTNYSYLGGAHGMYSTVLQSYDLAKRKALSLSDVFRPGYEAALSQALEKALRERYNLADDQSINTILFEDSIAPNENFGLTGRGILFNYAPYEIAAYAIGEIELYIPFKEIQDLLRPGIGK